MGFSLNLRKRLELPVTHSNRKRSTTNPGTIIVLKNFFAQTKVSEMQVGVIYVDFC
jgi:hypothetical protein